MNTLFCILDTTILSVVYIKYAKNMNSKSNQKLYYYFSHYFVFWTTEAVLCTTFWYDNGPIEDSAHTVIASTIDQIGAIIKWMSNLCITADCMFP